MNRVVLASALVLAMSPALAAGPPSMNLPSLAAPHAAQSGGLPLAPVVLDLGVSTPGGGAPFEFAPPPSELPGLADVIPYANNSAGRFNADLEVDTFGQKAYPTVNVYGLAFTDPPKHPLHLIGNLAGTPVDQRVDLPALP